MRVLTFAALTCSREAQTGFVSQRNAKALTLLLLRGHSSLLLVRAVTSCTSARSGCWTSTAERRRSLQWTTLLLRGAQSWLSPYDGFMLDWRRDGVDRLTLLMRSVLLMRDKEQTCACVVYSRLRFPSSWHAYMVLVVLTETSVVIDGSVLAATHHT